jgi:hypothetical protein
MLQDKGLNCRLVIANRPFGAPVTERAIPTVIFKVSGVGVFLYLFSLFSFFLILKKKKLVSKL